MMRKAISFDKGKILFHVFFFVQWIHIRCQLNHYNIHLTTQPNSFLQFHCLNYHVRQEKFVYQDLWHVIDDIIPYCFRPEKNFNIPSEILINPNAREMSFEELRLNNITFEQLFSWSIPLDIVQRYDLYVTNPTISLNENISNCTKPWFSVHCQYSFEYNKSMNFDEIVEDGFRRRAAYSRSSEMLVQIPCYVLLECHRNGQFWCLDWREICDGSVDCFDDGVDEKYCFDMEINECKANEFRCYNGLCISQDLWEDGDTECLDRSDETLSQFETKFCFRNPTFRCEEHTCRPDDTTFTCGDGECVLKFDNCQNGRHILLSESMVSKGNLSNECWIAMVCLTKLVKQINESSCEMLMNNSIDELLEQCDTFFQFPTIPIYSNHIRLYYDKPHLRQTLNEFYLPDYVCYNQQLCDFIVPTVTDGHLACHRYNELFSKIVVDKNAWINLAYVIGEYFYFCSSLTMFRTKTSNRHHSSLYQCQNSSKFISTYHIMDGKRNCFWNDDERYHDSCHLNHSHRVKCTDKDKCWSLVLTTDICTLNNGMIENEIPFQRFCDGIKEYFYDNVNNEYNDEYGCEDWCDNMYSRCDGYWACGDGRDENNCTVTKCQSGTYECVSSVNYTGICLPNDQVNDEGNIDCLGAADEQQICRMLNYGSPYQFRCSNYGPCLQASELCDGVDDCVVSDDDEKFCSYNIDFSCNQNLQRNRTDIERLLCGLSETKNHKNYYFLLHTSSNYPELDNNPSNEITHWVVNQHSNKNITISQLKDILWPWYCNRGLPIRIWINNNTYNISCLCPPSYYGHLCQYQNQRISLSLKLTSSYRYAIYSIFTMLIDEEQNIYAYDQYTYITKQICSIKLNRYLLYPTRPKNISKNYSIRIDIFDKNIMTYLGSWYYPITFSFLPATRLGISIILSNQQIQTSLNCSIRCQNGNCIKYINEDKYFCRCHSNWSGIYCHIPRNCQTCLFQSICIGSSYNQSLCLCPLHRFGSQCSLISTTTCLNNTCLNNGECIPDDITIPGNKYTCICPNEYFGKNCQYLKVRLDVSLVDIPIPSYLIAYFFTLSNTSDPINTTLFRKLTLFQHILTFHLSIPYHLLIIQTNHKFYLTVRQQTPKTFISTSITPSQQCFTGEELFNSTVLNINQYQRIIFYYDLCRRRLDVKCFIDDLYLCLCTNEHHANCMKFTKKTNFNCMEKNICENNGQCFQDHPTCPLTKICLCQSCFFGDKCQFYAKGLGSTLDEILGYEFKSNRIFFQQPFTIQISAAITMLIFVIGITDSISSMLIFSRKNSQEVGCGIYILASSITSFIVIILFTLKFWFLFLSYQDQYGSYFKQIIITLNCKFIELLLKISLYAHNWFTACVAIERSTSVLYGITFNKQKSKKIAKILTIIVPILILCLFIPQIIHLQVFEDKFEERSWCVIVYSSFLSTYSLISILFHYFAPLSINLFSALFIIIVTARQKFTIQPDQTFWFHFKSRLIHYKHLIISPSIIVTLTAPHLAIALILDCKKSYDLFWFYLIGYFLSFIPSASIFSIYVVPSSVYQREFKKILSHIQQRFTIMKQRASKL